MEPVYQKGDNEKFSILVSKNWVRAITRNITKFTTGHGIFLTIYIYEMVCKIFK